MAWSAAVAFSLTGCPWSAVETPPIGIRQVGDRIEVIVPQCPSYGIREVEVRHRTAESGTVLWRGRHHAGAQPDILTLDEHSWEEVEGEYQLPFRMGIDVAYEGIERRIGGGASREDAANLPTDGYKVEGSMLSADEYRDRYGDGSYCPDP